MNRSRKSRWRRKLLLVLFGFCFALLLTEVFLRLIGYSYPLFYIADYDRGMALRPGAAGLYQREGTNYVRINSAGLRDREHAKAKPADTVRIALLGDSYCEALQVPMEQTFWWLLQQKLESCNAFPGKHVEIINFGVSGYGTGQELITFEHQAREYSPDIVMLLITTNNDITDNRRELKLTDEIPYFNYQNGELALDNSFRDSADFRWHTSTTNRIAEGVRDHLRTVQLIYYVHMLAKLKLAEWRTRKAAPAPAGNQPAAAAKPDLSIDNMIYLEPGDENWREAWHVTEGLIKKMRDEVKQAGAQFVVVVGSNPIQVAPDPAVRQRFLDYIGAKDIFYPNLRLEELALLEPINVLDLAPSMQRFAEQNKVYLHGFGSDLGNGHWNAEGHRLAAELIAQKMCSARVR
ncbi:MAG TPA: SGNH/GDSL hydrolase family protein [Pyrinomonadaceae bacterium]|nr:SGNH/GDSL hydrolase family protein [Pyrinomonadaceae bacterium]